MDDDSIDLWSFQPAGDYEQANYGTGLAGRVLSLSHSLIEKRLVRKASLSQMLEAGCGSGLHPGFVIHDFDTYCLTDASEAMLQIARKRIVDGRFNFAQPPAECLPFARVALRPRAGLAPGQALGPRRNALKRGLTYDYAMAREHVDLSSISWR